MGYNTKVYWDGVSPKIQQRDKLIEWLKQFPVDQWFNMDLEPIGNINSTNQAKLYHKWVDILADEFGWTHKAMHLHLRQEYTDGRSTKGFSTKEWSAYMTKIQAFASENNITLPQGTSQ